jgi:ATP-dependent DNA helicase RecQ
MKLYSSQGKLDLLDEYTQLLIDHTALLQEDKEYIEKIQLAVQLEIHADELNSINQKYIEEL